MRIEDEIYKPIASDKQGWFQYLCSYCESNTTGHVVTYYPREIKTLESAKCLGLMCSSPNCKKGSVGING